MKNETIKMIALDLDGTLLQSDETISERTKSVLTLCRKSGIKVTYATGRGERSAKSVAPYEYFDGVVTQSGAVVAVGEHIISECIIPYEAARPLLMLFDAHEINTMSEDNKLYYTNFAVTNGFTSSANYKIVDFSTHCIDSQKINIFHKTLDEIDFVKKNLPDDLYFVMARWGHGMIMRKGATKLNGIMKLAELWGIDRESIVSFGYDEIDIDVLANTGIGVAMGNAIPEVKAASDYICDTNDNDGVAKWLEENVL